MSAKWGSQRNVLRRNREAALEGNPQFFHFLEELLSRRFSCLGVRRDHHSSRCICSTWLLHLGSSSRYRFSVDTDDFCCLAKNKKAHASSKNGEKCLRSPLFLARHATFPSRLLLIAGFSAFPSLYPTKHSLDFRRLYPI